MVHLQFSDPCTAGGSYALDLSHSLRTSSSYIGTWSASIRWQRNHALHRSTTQHFVSGFMGCMAFPTHQFYMSFHIRNHRLLQTGHQAWSHRYVECASRYRKAACFDNPCKL
eukprot:5766023-Amphidinium_carterae.1